VTFEQYFEQWLEQIANQASSRSTVAYSFNLYEPAFEPGVRFGIELVGAGSFNPDNADWACDEVWEPKPRGINIPIEFSGTRWEECLARVRNLLRGYVQQECRGSTWLKSKTAIGLGFVDGELELVWKKG
jgi:hypothetical protein